MNIVLCRIKEPHDPHPVTISVFYPCSGPFECGTLGKYHPEHLTQSDITIDCLGLVNKKEN